MREIEKVTRLAGAPLTAEVVSACKIIDLSAWAARRRDWGGGESSSPSSEGDDERVVIHGHTCSIPCLLLV